MKKKRKTEKIERRGKKKTEYQDALATLSGAPSALYRRMAGTDRRRMMK